MTILEKGFICRRTGRNLLTIHSHAENVYVAEMHDRLNRERIPFTNEILPPVFRVIDLGNTT